MFPLAPNDPSVIGRYQLLACLGQGGMGRVYLAIGPDGKRLAVKQILPHLASDSGFHQRFALEVEAARKVAGPHTLPVIDADTAAEAPWSATEFVPGPTLIEAINQEGHLPAAVVRAVGMRLAEALDSVHEYGTTLRDRDELCGHQWERVVCDEAQAIKNSAARQAAAVRSISARTRLALTGTPMENHLAELWSIMEFCNPGLMGPYAGFRRRFQEPIERDHDADATEALRRATAPFVLRRLKTDKTIISDLPEKVEMKQWCHLTMEQASLYQAVTNDMLDRIADSDGIERHGKVLAAMTKLKQVCNHPANLLRDGTRLDGRSGKLTRLEELCEELLNEGDKALVFTQFADMGHLLQPRLEARLGREVLWLHGGLTKKRRQTLVDRFQTGAEPTVFLLSLKAAGTGLNLTAANHVVHFDRWWNPAVENQATDRAFRIGQAKNVQVRKFICKGTLEERIDGLIERKKSLAEQVVGSDESWLSELSTKELHDLFTLSKEATLP